MSSDGDGIPESHFEMGGGTVHIGVFVVICLYVLVVGGFAYFSFMKNKYHSSITGDEQTSYFLAGRSFGKWLLFLTMFSTLFSGFTVVFVPLEAAWAGLGKAGRWFTLAGLLPVCNTYVPALRMIGLERGHTTLLEFFTDAYRSTSLTILYTCTIAYSTIPYIVAQFVALDQTVSTLTHSAKLGQYAMVVFAYFIFACEIVGGMRAVAITDAIQSGVMISMYFVMPLVLWACFGGMGDMMGEGCGNSQPYANVYANTSLSCRTSVLGHCNPQGCAQTCASAKLWECSGNATGKFAALDMLLTVCGAGNYDNSTAGLPCNAKNYGKLGHSMKLVDPAGGSKACPGCFDNLKYFGGSKVQYPSHTAAGGYAIFKWASMPITLAILAPQTQFFSRWMAAKSEGVIKFGMYILSPIAFFIYMVGIYIGVSFMANHGPLIGKKYGPLGIASPFAGTMEDLINLGGFPELIAVIMMCGAVAAFMSTADSLVIGWSSVVSVDIFQNILWQKLRWGDDEGRRVTSSCPPPLVASGCASWVVEDPSLGVTVFTMPIVCNRDCFALPSAASCSTAKS